MPLSITTGWLRGRRCSSFAAFCARLLLFCARAALVCVCSFFWRLCGRASCRNAAAAGRLVIDAIHDVSRAASSAAFLRARRLAS